MIMKKIRMALAAFAIAATLASFNNLPATSIKGKVTPAKYCGVYAWAISDKDTLYTTVNDGSFEFDNAKPGVYRIIIEAASPYKHMAKDGVVVKEGQAIDLGELSLQKWECTFKPVSK
jgi:hypothetical protein